MQGSACGYYHFESPEYDSQLEIEYESWPYSNGRKSKEKKIENKKNKGKKQNKSPIEKRKQKKPEVVNQSPNMTPRIGKIKQNRG